jgi:hypothetical protein
LRPLADGASSSPRTRQNLALAYGLKGDVEAARRQSLLDLDPVATDGNLAFFAMLRNGGPETAGPALASTLSAPPPVPSEQPALIRTTPRETPAPVAATKPPRRLAQRSPKPVAEDLPPEVQPAAGPLPALPANGADADRWLLRVGSFDGPAAAQLGWRELRAAHADLLGSLTRMPAGQMGPQPNLAGPVASEAEADRICARLKADAVACEKVRM